MLGFFLRGRGFFGALRLQTGNHLPKLLMQGGERVVAKRNPHRKLAG